MTREQDQERREMVRAYLLGTLSEAEQEQVAARVEKDPAWREALEEERKALAALDALSDETPPPGLAASTIARAEELRGRKRKFVAKNLWPAALVAAIVLTIALPLYVQFRENRLDALANYNLKQIGLAMKMYANESQGERYPPLAPSEDVWIFDVQALYPRYLSDLTILASPRLPGYRDRAAELAALQHQEPIDWERVNRIAAESYTYLGYLATGPRDIERLGQERTRLARAGREGVERVGDEPLFRLREGIERFLITDINNPGSSMRARSEILLLMETPPPPSEPDRSKRLVLYLDGHIEDLEPDSELLQDPDVRSILHPRR